MGFDNPIVGGTALRIPAIQSPNYNPGVAGWIIKINGDAEFNNLTVRGEFLGASLIINSAGIFLYSAAPATGNLIGSWASASGTDAFTNAYPAGLNLKDANGTLLSSGTVLTLTANDGSSVVLDAAGLYGNGIYVTPPASGSNTWVPGAVYAQFSSGPPDSPYLAIYSPYEDTGAAASQIILTGADSAGSNTLIDMYADTFSYGDTASEFVVDGTSGDLTTYSNNTFTTYTPTVAGGGTVTWTTRTGWWMRVGKMIFFNAYLVVNAAGSGAGVVTITAPTSIDRTTEQPVPCHTTSTTTAGAVMNGHAVALTTGATNVIDRISVSNDGATNRDNILAGANLLAGARVSIAGWYREA